MEEKSFQTFFNKQLDLEMNSLEKAYLPLEPTYSTRKLDSTFDSSK